MKKKKNLFFINLILFLAIVFIVYLKIYKKKITFDCEYGASPVEISTIAEDIFPKNEINSERDGKEVIGKTLCIFNTLPHLSELENLNKLHNLHENKMPVEVIFTKKFKRSFPLKFPHKFLTRYKFSCTSNNIDFDDNFYLVFREGKIIYSDKNLDFIDMNFIIQKNSSGLSLVDSQISAKKLKTKIIKRINENKIVLLDLNTDGPRQLENFSDFAEIHFFHVNCSACKLKGMLKNLKLKKIINEERVLIIFSIFANRFELKTLLEQENIQLPVYIDYRDEFFLHSQITDDKENPIVITQEELRGANE